MADSIFKLLLFSFMLYEIFLCNPVRASTGDICDLYSSIDLSDGIRFDNGTVLLDDIYYDRNMQLVEENNGTTIYRGCICLIKKCINICGSKRDKFEDKLLLNPFYDGKKLVNDTEQLIITYKYRCPFKIARISNKDYPMYLQTNGSLLAIEGNTPTIYTRDEYCVDFVELPNEDEGTKYRLDALLCFPEQKQNEDHKIKINILSTAMLISVPFLIITLVVYCILPELHNLHGYIMITYLSCLTVFFIFLSAVQITTAESKIAFGMCLFMDFSVYFSGMASFFWMNVMCFDIWWTFSGQRSWQGIGQVSIKKRYMLYSIYAWIIPTLLTCVLAYMQFNKSLWANNIYPGFGVRNCWFHEPKSQFVYMYVPIGILLVCNLVLFSATTYRIFSISRETQMLQENQSKKRTFEKERQRFFLYIKLFTVMGLNWILEIVSFFVDETSKGWIVSDVFNTLIGVFIFIIFVLKRKILKLLVKRYQKLRYGTIMSRTTKSYSDSCQSSCVSGSKKEKQLLELKQSGHA